MANHPTPPQDLNALLIQLATQSGGVQVPQANRGLLAPGQESFGDVLRNPSQSQVSGLLTGLAASLNPNTVSPLASGLIGGLQGFQARENVDLRSRQQAAEFKRTQLQNRIGNIIDISRLGLGQTAEARQERGEQRLQSAQELAETKRDSVDILDAQGTFMGTAVQGPRGRLFQFDEAGQPVDVSAEIQAQNFRVAPAGRPQTQISIDTGTKTAAVNVLNRAFLTRLASPENVNAVKANQSALITAQRAEALSGDALTGAGAETLINIGSGMQTLLRAAGLDLAANRIDVSTEQQLRATSVDALKPYIEAQGRGFTDADRENALKGIAGLANARETNIMLARISQVSALSEQDKFFFDDAIGGQLTTGERKTPSGSEAAFNQYSRDLSHSKLANGKFTVIDRGTQLWKYYTNGRPKAWITSQGEFSTGQLKKFAKDKGLTFREFLENRELKGEIQGVR